MAYLQQAHQDLEDVVSYRLERWHRISAIDSWSHAAPSPAVAAASRQAVRVLIRGDLLNTMGMIALSMSDAHCVQMTGPVLPHTRTAFPRLRAFDQVH